MDNFFIVTNKLNNAVIGAFDIDAVRFNIRYEWNADSGIDPDNIQIEYIEFNRVYGHGPSGSRPYWSSAAEWLGEFGYE